MNDLESRLKAAMHNETADLAARPDLADAMVSRGGKVRRRHRVLGSAACLVILAVLIPVWKTIDTSSGPLAPADQASPSGITQSPPPDPTTTIPTPPPWSSAAVDQTRSPARVPLVTAMRVAEHDGYDRVVIDMSGPMCSYHIAYVPRLTEDASGAPVHLPGRAFLSVVLLGANAHTAGGVTVYFPAHEKRTYPFTTLRGTAFTGDHESTVSFGLALSRKAGFQVSELTSPTRLVIDVRH